MQIIETSIKPQAMRQVLIRATLWGACGACFLLGALFIPADNLAYGGFFLALFSFVMIAWAFRPLQRLKKLEVNPEQLVLTDTEIVWIKKGDRIHIPREKIRSINYQENKQFYGIVIRFISDQELKLPYFSERSYKKIEKNINF